MLQQAKTKTKRTKSTKHKNTSHSSNPRSRANTGAIQNHLIAATFRPTDWSFQDECGENLLIVRHASLHRSAKHLETQHVWHAIPGDSEPQPKKSCRHEPILTLRNSSPKRWNHHYRHQSHELRHFTDRIDGVKMSVTKHSWHEIRTPDHSHSHRLSLTHTCRSYVSFTHKPDAQKLQHAKMCLMTNYMICSQVRVKKLGYYESSLKLSVGFLIVYILLAADLSCIHIRCS